MRTPGYRSRSTSIWPSRSWSRGVGYSATQCISVSARPRCRKKLTTASISGNEAVAVEATMGLSTFAIRSRSGQSVNEALAILMMSIPISSIVPTDASSNGVHAGTNPFARISATSASKFARVRRVSSNRLMYLRSARPRALAWMYVSRSRNWSLNANWNWSNPATAARMARMSATP